MTRTVVVMRKITIVALFQIESRSNTRFHTHTRSPSPHPPIPHTRSPHPHPIPHIDVYTHTYGSTHGSTIPTRPTDTDPRIPTRPTSIIRKHHTNHNIITITITMKPQHPTYGDEYDEKDTDTQTRDERWTRKQTNEIIQVHRYNNQIFRIVCPGIVYHTEAGISQSAISQLCQL